MKKNFQTFHQVTTVDTGKTYTLGAEGTPNLYGVKFETGLLCPRTGNADYPSRSNYRNRGVSSHEFYIEEETAKKYGIIPPAPKASRLFLIRGTWTIVRIRQELSGLAGCVDGTTNALEIDLGTFSNDAALSGPSR